MVFNDFVAQGNAILQLQLHAHYHLQIQLLIKQQKGYQEQQGGATTREEDDQVFATPRNDNSNRILKLGPSTPFEEQHAVSETLSYYESRAKVSPEMAAMAAAANKFARGQLSPVPNEKESATPSQPDVSEQSPVVDLQLWNTWMTECVATLQLNAKGSGVGTVDGGVAGTSRGGEQQRQLRKQAQRVRA